MSAPVPTNGNMIPPQNLEAEESVLGAMMLAPGAIDAVIDTELDAGDFYRESHGSIFRAALALHAEGEPVDAITVAAKLERSGVLDGVGGRVRVHELARLVPASSNASHYARIVKSKALLRGLILAGGGIAALGWAGEGEPSELLAEAEKLMTSVADQGGENDAAPLSEGLAEVGLTVKDARETGVVRRGRLTGLTNLDSILNGFWDGQLIIVGARPGVGKSMLALNITENFAARGERVLFVSLEMSRAELQLRQIARECRIDGSKLQGALLSDEDFEKLRQGFKRLNERGSLIQVKDSGATSAAQIKAEARRLKRSGEGLGLVVVDYVQLMIVGAAHERVAELSQITRALKQLAMELKVPVLGLSQLNRDTLHGDSKRPQLSNLRDGGSLEQDADVVIGMYHEAAHEPNVDAAYANEVELIVLKNRKGGQGTAKVNAIWRYSVFEDLSIIPKGAG